MSLSLIADAIPSVNVSTISSSEKLPKDLVSLVTPAG